MDPKLGTDMASRSGVVARGTLVLGRMIGFMGLAPLCFRMATNTLEHLKMGLCMEKVLLF